MDEMQLIGEMGAGVYMLMGLSFVLGSFVTILLLLLLDFMRRDKVDGGPK